MKIFRKLFVKDYQNTEDPKVRTRYGSVASVMGIISNTILCVFKLLMGIIGNSITIIADAINNLTDAGSSVVTLLGFKIAAKPADKEHPFGHARFEYVTELLISIIILFIGILLLKSSIEKCITPEEISVSVYTYVVLGVAIGLKFLQMLIYVDFSKAIESGALKASSQDSRNDAITTTAILISTIVIHVTKVNIDGYMGVAVSLFIIISAFKLLFEAIKPILGEKPEPEIVELIKTKFLSYEGILGYHDLVVHNYGHGQYFAVIHAEVDACKPILETHDIIDNIERDFWVDLKIHLNVHMDPIETNNEVLNEMKEKVGKLLEELDTTLTFHDFRMVEGGTHTNILFDVVVPFDCKLSKADILSYLSEKFNTGDMQYFFIIDVDRQMS